ncbi:MAG: serine--tRNA ligase, partial [Calditrichia bacterium]
MLDLKFIRENAGLVKKGIKNKGEMGNIDIILKLDNERRAMLQEVESLKHERNQLSQEVSRLKKEGQAADEIIEKTRTISQKIKDLDEQIKDRETLLQEEMEKIPNLPHASVPIGKNADDNVVMRAWGKIPEFDFQISDHLEIAQRLNIMDFPRGSKVSGRGFPVYLGKG